MKRMLVCERVWARMVVEQEEGGGEGAWKKAGFASIDLDPLDHLHAGTRAEIKTPRFQISSSLAMCLPSREMEKRGGPL